MSRTCIYFGNREGMVLGGGEADKEVSKKGETVVVELAKVVDFADAKLQIKGVEDYPGARNGLQLENKKKEVTRIAAAVDGHLGVVEKAIEAQADLLVVHHGLFWSPLLPLTGVPFKKLACAIEGGLAIYSAHLPLDIHPELGNNALLAKALGLESPRPFFFSKDQAIGLRFSVDKGRKALVEDVGKVVGGTPHVLAHGPERVTELGIVTGGGGGEVARAAAEGVDTFLTGEGPQHSYGVAREWGVNVIYAGHYATEVFGVKALAQLLSNVFEVPWVFLDEPTGL